MKKVVRVNFTTGIDGGDLPLIARGEVAVDSRPEFSKVLFLFFRS